MPICLLLAATLHAQESTRHKVIRRTLAGTACAASAFDSYQSQYAFSSNRGFIELNPVGFNKKLLLLKAVACAAPIVIGEVESHRGNTRVTTSITWGSAINTAFFAVVDWHNQRLIDHSQQPGQVAH